jgi:hypothetical protein
VIGLAFTPISIMTLDKLSQTNLILISNSKPKMKKQTYEYYTEPHQQSKQIFQSTELPIKIKKQKH